MTLQEAITALLEEYEIEDFVECVRDEVKGDPSFDGLSRHHPRVQRFRDVCQVLRAFSESA